ncbi:uncharacterized protein ACR2FA_004560, partial [Aphomia sociella]
IARMTQTDWMMFDFVLVHEKIDFTGVNFNWKSEPLTMLELFSLVQHFGIEGLQGDKLASAWTAATIHYNSGLRQCSPMLLQRRWYQIKELTRMRFYKFWFSYRGHPNLLEKARKLHTSTKLQWAVAKRYPHIITMPFIPWEEMIEKELVILPEEFEKRMRTLNNASDLPKPCRENSPDLIIVKPDIEVIDLRVDSDSETEFYDQDLANEGEKILAATTAKDKAIDLNSTDEPAETDDAQPSTSQMVQVEQKDELDDIYLATIPKQYNISNHNVKDTVNTFSENYSDDQDLLNVQGQPAEDLAIDATDDPAEDLATDPIVYRTYDSTILDDKETIKEQSSTEIASPGDSEPIMMPLITNVFGNVHIENQTLTKISSVLMEKSKAYTTPITTDVIPLKFSVTDNLEQTTSIEPIEVVDDDVEIIDDSEDITKCASFKSSVKTCNVKDNIYLTVGNEINNFEDVTFVDNGIKCENDDIALFDYCEDKNTNMTQSNIKDVIECDANENEAPQFNFKLLMDCMVYTTKLEDMIYFRNKCYEHVKLEKNLNDIIKESKPVRRKYIQKPRKEYTVQPDCDLEYKNMNDDLFDNNSVVSDNSVSSNSENEISEKMKVTISSGLLQKPRIRTYNPINLCKNPDFNTRLKRLTVGFLSSTCNRRLLKVCKPMTIDVNKVFESKLIDGTLYLKSNSVLDNNELVNTDTNECNNTGNQNTTVVPSAMLVQSLIDNIKVSDISWPSLTNNNSPQKHNNDQIVSNHEQDVCKRNKVINLPDIDNIRRINQRLLTAEVMPMPVNMNKEIRPTDVILSGENQIQDVPNLIRNKVNHSHGTSNVENIKMISFDTLPDNNQQVTDNILKPRGQKSKNMYIEEKDHTSNITKRSRVVGWRPKYAASLKLQQKVRADEYEKRISSNASDLDDKQRENNNRHTLSTLPEEHLEIGIGSELPVEIPKHAEPTIKYNNDCCWARRKTNHIKKDNCLPGQCTCCCKKDLEESENNKNVCVILSDDEDENVIQESHTQSGDLENIKTVNTIIENVENISIQVIDSISAKVASSNIEIECKSTKQNINVEIISPQLNDLVTKVADSTLNNNNNSENSVPQLTVEENKNYETETIVIDDDNFIDPDSSNHTDNLSSTTPAVDNSKTLYSDISLNNSSDLGSTNSMSSNKCRNNIKRQLIIDKKKGVTSPIFNILTKHVMHFNRKHVERPLLLGRNKILLTNLKLTSTRVYLRMTYQIRYKNKKNTDINNVQRPVLSSNQLDSTVTENKESGDKRKSILSDLMEMSGISAEDATSVVPNDNTYDSVPLPSTSSNDLLSEIPTSNSDIVNGTSLFSNLYLVSTFNELKNAYDNGGKFYKYDIQTGILLVTNVRLKRKRIPIRTQVIDLTNDNVTTDKPKSVHSKKIKMHIEKPVKLFGVKSNLVKKLTPQKNTRKKKKQEVSSTDTIKNKVLMVDDKTDYPDSHDGSSDDEPLAKKSKRNKQKTSFYDDIAADIE